MEKQLTTEEIVLETIAYYRTHKRGYNPIVESCRYYLNGKMCAVGRCLKEPHQFADCSKSVCGFDMLFKLEEQLKPRYQGHNLDFWDNLQGLHDRSNHWIYNNQGGQDLTEIGKNYIKTWFKIKL